MDAAVRAEIDALHTEVSAAADAVMTAVERAQGRLGGWAADPAATTSAIAGDLHAVLEACIFGDLVAQRLSTLQALLDGMGGASADPLMNGPAHPGEGLDQAAVDALWATTASAEA